MRRRWVSVGCRSSRRSASRCRPRSKSPACRPKKPRTCASAWPRRRPIAPPTSNTTPVLPGTRATLQRRPDGRQFVRLTSDRGVQEPFVDVILEISWATGRLVREYTLLFDPPTMARAPAPSPAVPAAAARSTAPAVAEAPPRCADGTAARGGAARRAACRRRRLRPPPRQPNRARRVTPQRAEHAERAFGRLRRRRVPRPSRRFALAHRDEDAAAGRVARPDAGRAVPHQPAGLHQQQHEPAEVGRGACRSDGRCGPGDHAAAGARSHHRTERRLRRLPPAPRRNTMPAAPEGSARQSSGKVQATVEDRKQAAAPTPDADPEQGRGTLGRRPPKPSASSRSVRRRRPRRGSTNSRRTSSKLEKLGQAGRRPPRRRRRRARQRRPRRRRARPSPAPPAVVAQATPPATPAPAAAAAPLRRRLHRPSQRRCRAGRTDPRHRAASAPVVAPPPSPVAAEAGRQRRRGRQARDAGQARRARPHRLDDGRQPARRSASVRSSSRCSPASASTASRSARRRTAARRRSSKAACSRIRSSAPAAASASTRATRPATRRR